MKSDTVIIIPAYNEARSIGGVVSSVRGLHPGVDTVVVDDGSSDATAEAAREAGALVLSHPFNMGYGVSIQTGYKYALDNNYDYLVQMDGDGQHDPAGVKVLLKNLKAEPYDIILGSRFLKPNGYKASAARMAGIRFFRFALRAFAGQRITDPTTGFQAMRRKVLEVFARDSFPYDYPDADVIILLSKLKFRMKEVPLVMHPNAQGKSMHKNPVMALYYIFKMSLSMFVTKIRRY